MGTHPTGWESHTEAQTHNGRKNILHNTQTTNRFVPWFTLYREYKTINLDNMTLTTYKYIPQCTFQVQSQKHKHEVIKFPQSQLSQYPTSYHMMSHSIVGHQSGKRSIHSHSYHVTVKVTKDNDAWSGGLLDCLDDQYHFVLSCVHAPWTWGFFVCFAPCFAYPM